LRKRVLQKNIIIRLECGARQGAVDISASTDDTFTDLTTHESERIVSPDDVQSFIHVPTSPEKDAMEGHSLVRHTLDQPGIRVSTGSVVDFRLKDHLREMPQDGRAHSGHDR